MSTLDDSSQTASRNNLRSFFKLAVCKPDACSANDFNLVANELINLYITKFTFPPLFQDIMCQTKETWTDISAADIVTIVIISIIVLLMIVSSVYDFYLYKTHKETQNLMLLAFSVISNGKKLLHVSKNSKDQINVFHGLKTISMMWIIAGHAFGGWVSLSVSNGNDVSTWQSKRSAGYITPAHLAVDTFFFISGFLLAYQYLKQKPQPLLNHLKSVPKMYIHRYLRLTPAMLMLYLVTISLFRHLGTGPLWPAHEDFVEICRKRWWSYFLYIQNYYNWDDLCLIQTWYLSADMQMFLLAPLVLIPIALQLREQSQFFVVMIELLIINLFFTFLPMITKLVFQDYANIYDTHSMLIDYFIGVMLGVFMRVKHNKPFLYMIKSGYESIANLLIWIVILLGLLAVILSYQEVEMNHGYTSRSVFYSLMRPAWCIGLSWITYSCYHGYGGIINWFLCRPIFQIWGRLTYSMYLIHVLVVLYYLVIIRTRLYFSDFVEFYYFCGHYVMSLVVAVFWTLAFESPLITVEKVIFGRGGGKKQVSTPRNGNVEEAPRRDVS